MADEFERNHRIAVIGGGPGGYEAALAGAQQGAEVVIVERAGIGGSAVLTDVVPSKTLIATANATGAIARIARLGVRFSVPNDSGRQVPPEVSVDLRAVNGRLKNLAHRQSDDMRADLERAGIRIVEGEGRLDGPDRVIVSTGRGARARDFDEIDTDTIVVATGASPRKLPTAMPDGERILTWTQLYELDELPEHMIVVGSGVTGAEFASAYVQLGSEVTLVSSRDRVLPGEDGDAAALL